MIVGRNNVKQGRLFAHSPALLYSNANHILSKSSLFVTSDKAWFRRAIGDVTWKKSILVWTFNIWQNSWSWRTTTPPILHPSNMHQCVGEFTTQPPTHCRPQFFKISCMFTPQFGSSASTFHAMQGKQATRQSHANWAFFPSSAREKPCRSMPAAQVSPQEPQDEPQANHGAYWAWRQRFYRGRIKKMAGMAGKLIWWTSSSSK